MRKKFLEILVILACLLLANSINALAITTTIQQGQITDIGINQFLTDFGMIKGSITFSLGDLKWVPEAIWLLPSEIDPDVFSKNLTIKSYLEIPKNVTFSTCRTAIYFNQSVGYGFKIYNTETTTQILPNGTFCGLAYNGTYFIYAKF